MSARELLSKLDPATSAYIAQMQGRDRDMGTRSPAEDERLQRNARSMVCLTCRGRQRRKIKAPTPEEPDRRMWVDCEDCHGSGKREEGAARQSPTKGAPATVGAERLAEAIAFIDRPLLLAAILETTGNRSVVGELEGHVAERIVTPRSDGWGVGPDARAIRVLGLARIVTASLLLPGDRLPKSGEATVLMCCQAQDWRRTWRPRAEPMVEIARGWSAQAGNEMRENLSSDAT